MLLLIPFLVADDLRYQLGFQQDEYPLSSRMHERMITPNLDKLASQSLFFHRAYVQYALCAPSRTSVLTSRRPTTTKVYGFDNYFRETMNNATTIPQYFKEHGYRTVNMGKIFHNTNER